MLLHEVRLRCWKALSLPLTSHEPEATSVWPRTSFWLHVMRSHDSCVMFILCRLGTGSDVSNPWIPSSIWDNFMGQDYPILCLPRKSKRPNRNSAHKARSWDFWSPWGKLQSGLWRMYQWDSDIFSFLSPHLMFSDLPGPLLPLRGSSPTRTVCLLKEEPSGCAAPFIMVGRKRTLMGNALCSHIKS